MDSLNTFPSCQEKAPLSVFVAESNSDQTASPLPQGLQTAFADVTGWELGLIGEEVQIVDMSPTWPPSRPTANRRTCDQLAAEISKLLSK